MKDTSYGSVKQPEGRVFPVQAGNSVLLTAGLIIADVVGAGILAMGSAVAHLGWLLGTISIPVFLAMNIHVSILLWRVRRLHPGASTYLELASMVFEKAPGIQLRTMQGLVAGSQNLFIFSMLSVYTLSIGKGLSMFAYELHVCLPTMALGGCAMLLPLSLTARSLGAYSSPIWINVATTLGTILIPIIWMSFQGAEVTRPSGASFMAVAEDLTLSTFFQAASTFSFAFSGQFMIVEIISEMQNPEDFPKAYALSAPYQAGAFLLVGLSVYYFRGAAAADMVVFELPFGALTRLAAVCLVLHMAVTYVVKNIVLCKNLLMYCQRRPLIEDSGSNTSVWPWYLMVSGVMCASWLLAQIIPFLGDLVDLLGATLVPTSCYILPILLLLRCLQERGPDFLGIGPAELTVVGIEFVLAITLMVFGSATAMSNIAHHWHTYGPPFACHCEDVWNTCACSPARNLECPAGHATGLLQH